MCGDLVRDAALLDVVFLRQAKVLFRSHVAQHAGSVPCGGRRANAACEGRDATSWTGKTQGDEVDVTALKQQSK